MIKIKCGFSQTDITPVPGEVYLEGYGHRITPSTGIRDKLYVKACAMGSQDDVFVIVSFDICGFNEELSRRLRGYIKTLCGLDDSQFAVCATHTHAGPAVGLLQDLPVNYLYWNAVGEKAAFTVKKAVESLCEGYLGFSFGGGLVSSFNRRGGQHIDRRVRTAAFFDKNRALKGVIASASCHAVVCTDYNISADYPAVLTREGAKIFPGVPMMFLQGRGADIDPHFTGGITRDEMYEKLGNELASSVFSALEDLKTDISGFGGGTVRSLYRTAEIPMGYPPLNQLEASFEDYQNQLRAASGESEKRYPARERLWHYEAIEAVKSGKNPNITAALQIAAIGSEAMFAFIPFELLTITGNTLEELFAGMGYGRESIFVAGYSNGTNGYLAPAEEFDAGGYEISVAAHWCGIPECTRQSEPAVLSAIKDMAQELTKQ